jgi:hypothetical protein
MARVLPLLREKTTLADIAGRLISIKREIKSVRLSPRSG